MQRKMIRKYQTGALRRYTVLALMTVFGYLAQVCVMPYIRPFGISPNILFVVIGVVTVAYGKLRAFWVGIVFGLLMEIMIPTVPYISIALYPISTLFCSFAFADKPLKTLEYERAVSRQRMELPPWVRTVFCAMLNTLVYETVQITYIYLGGNALTVPHFLRGIADVLLTGVLCFLLQFPVRRLIFGHHRTQPVMRPAPVVFTRS